MQKDGNKGINLYLINKGSKDITWSRCALVLPLHIELIIPFEWEYHLLIISLNENTL